MSQQWVYYALVVDYSANDTTVRLYAGTMGGTLSLVAEEVASTGVSMGMGTGMVPNPLVNPGSQGGINGKLNIGHFLDNSGNEADGNGFQGAVDDARFYDRALTLTELNALFSEPPSTGN